MRTKSRTLVLTSYTCEGSCASRPSPARRKTGRGTGVTLLVWIVAIGAVFTFYTPQGHAQTPPVRKPFRILLGWRETREYQSEHAFYLSTGVSYAIAQSARSARSKSSEGYAQYQLYLDYATRSISFINGSGDEGHYGIGGTHGREHVLGVGPAVTFHLGPENATAHPFVGAGAGYYNVKRYFTSAKGRFGGKVFAGVECKKGFLIEADYTKAGGVEGVRTGGGGLRLGYRF